MEKSMPTIFIAIGTILIVVSFGLYALKLSSGELGPALASATSAVPESFTELYFENHSKLPNKINKGLKYPVSYTIHNLENKDVEYKVLVYLQWGVNRIVLNERLVPLKHKESITLNEFVGPFPETRTKVVIELLEQDQSISFWMDTKV